MSTLKATELATLLNALVAVHGDLYVTTHLGDDIGKVELDPDDEECFVLLPAAMFVD